MAAQPSRRRLQLAIAASPEAGGARSTIGAIGEVSRDRDLEASPHAGMGLAAALDQALSLAGTADGGAAVLLTRRRRRWRG